MFLASRHRFFAAVFCAWSLIVAVTLSTADSDARIFFTDDDDDGDDVSLLSTADLSAIDTGAGEGGFSSSDLFSEPSSITTDIDSSIFEIETDPNSATNWDDDSSMFLTAASDSDSDSNSGATPLEETSSSCIGDNDDDSSSSTTTTLNTNLGKEKKTKKMKKMRREDNKPMCLENNNNNPTSPNLNLDLPDLQNLERPASDPKPKLDFAPPLSWDNNRCPPQHKEHVCCTGPVIEEYPFLGLYQMVQGCQPCMLFYVVFVLDLFNLCFF